jgi:hypothetical protein
MRSNAMSEVKSCVLSKKKTGHEDLSCIAQNGQTGDIIGQGTCTGLVPRLGRRRRAFMGEPTYEVLLYSTQLVDV